MLKSVCVLFSLLFLASLASAEIFKYVGRNGEDLYQNFPCQFESMGGTPTDVPAPKKSPTEVLGPKKLPTVPAEPRVGMTTDEVRAIWGERTDTVQEELGNGSRFEVWSYGAFRSVRFDRKDTWLPYSSRVTCPGGTYKGQSKQTSHLVLTDR